MRIWSTMCAAAMLAGIIVQVPAQPRDEPTDVLDKYSPVKFLEAFDWFG